MKSVLMSIQPYWVFLIIARKMGWHIDKEKTIEVRNNFPKDQDWNRSVEIYCSKDKKSFSQIPKKYQPLMKKFLGKVIGEFFCDKKDFFFAEYCDNGSADLTPSRLIYGLGNANSEIAYLDKCCLTHDELFDYIISGKYGFGWHITDLKIYDKPKELSEFRTPTDCESVIAKDMLCNTCCICSYFCTKKPKRITRPPQSWCYVELLKELQE